MIRKVLKVQLIEDTEKADNSKGLIGCCHDMNVAIRSNFVHVYHDRENNMKMKINSGGYNINTPLSLCPYCGEKIEFSTVINTETVPDMLMNALWPY